MATNSFSKFLYRWQELIAIMVGVIAAWAAYRGAVMQARATRDTAREATDRRRYAFARFLIKEALELALAAGHRMETPEKPAEPLVLPEAFHADWEALSLLDIPGQNALLALTRRIRHYNDGLQHASADEIRGHLAWIQQNAEALSDDLMAFTERLRPGMEGNSGRPRRLRRGI